VGRYRVRQKVCVV